MKRSGMPRRTRELDRGSKRLAQSELRRSGSLARHVPVKRRNRKRATENLERAHGPAERREWIKRLPCLICGRRPCDGAHIKNGGMSRKADAEFTVPLCSDDVAECYSGHHSEHHRGQKSFERKYGIDLRSAAEATERRWQDHLNRTAA